MVLLNLVISILLFMGSAISSVMYVNSWVQLNMPYQLAWIDLLLTRLLHGRPTSNQLLISSWLLFGCGYLMKYGLDANPAAADAIFPFYGLAVMFLFTTMAVSFGCLLVAPLIWIREQVVSAKP